MAESMECSEDQSNTLSIERLLQIEYQTFSENSQSNNEQNRIVSRSDEVLPLREALHTPSLPSQNTRAGDVTASDLAVGSTNSHSSTHGSSGSHSFNDEIPANVAHAMASSSTNQEQMINSRPPLLAQYDSDRTTNSAEEEQSRGTESTNAQLEQYLGDFQLRGYQEEISQSILHGRNDIIILPTGTGKTAVAVNLISKHLREHSKPKVVFMAPRVAIVEQLYEVVRQRIPPEWASKVRKITGGDITTLDDLQAAIVGEHTAVIVATPQIILNYFWGFSSASMSHFTLLIFDEFHHNKGENPYRMLCNAYVDEMIDRGKSRLLLPQMLGLTATIGIGAAKNANDAVAFIKDLCATMDLQAQPTEVRDQRNKNELESCFHKPDEVPSLVSELRNDDFMSYIKQTIVVEIKDYIARRRREEPLFSHVTYEEPKDIAEQSFEARCQKAVRTFSRIHDLSPNQAAHDCIIALEHLKLYYITYKWANLARSTDALNYLQREISDPIYSASPFLGKFRDYWSVQLQMLAAKEVENEKLRVLRLTLQQKVRWDDDEPPRILIFCEHRYLTILLKEYLLQLNLPQVTVERYVSTNAKEEKYGMSRVVATDILKKFRTGEINVLVSTSVLSEGIDVAECNAIIIYMNIKDMIQGVQVPGRARRHGGTVIPIIDQKQYEMYLSNKRKEQMMVQALAAVRTVDRGVFKQMIATIQENGYKERKSIKEKNQQSQSRKPSEAQIQCMRCGNRVGQLSDIKKYLRNYYLILDRSLPERVDVEMIVEGETMDGMRDTGKVHCKNASCKCELGKVIKCINRLFGIWDIESIRIQNSRNQYPKWQKVDKDYRIMSIMHEQLRLEAEEHCLHLNEC